MGLLRFERRGLFGSALGVVSFVVFALSISLPIEAGVKTVAIASAEAEPPPDGLGNTISNDPEERAVTDFIVENLPPPDVDILTPEYLSSNSRLALKAWREAPWKDAVPWDVFLNYVAPYALVDEQRDEWRPMMYRKASGLLAGITEQVDAVLAVNKGLWSLWEPAIKFVADQTPKTMSPFQVIAARNASCTGLSIFLVGALRSVGLPARMAGVPQWNTPTGGNHDWVEVYISGRWHFVGAAEPDPQGLDHGWFFPDPVSSSVPGGTTSSVYATSWAPTDVRFPLSWSPDVDWVHADEVTEAYVTTGSRSTQ